MSTDPHATPDRAAKALWHRIVAVLDQESDRAVERYKARNDVVDSRYREGYSDGLERALLLVQREMPDV